MLRALKGKTNLQSASVNLRNGRYPHKAACFGSEACLGDGGERPPPDEAWGLACGQRGGESS